MNRKRFTFYKDYPKTCSKDDFWGQVKRTVNGQPVSQTQIDLIVEAVVKELALKSEDVLLDLCCGNGALSTLFFKYCKAGMGVDFSEYLVEVANTNFSKPPDQVYIVQDAVEFCERPDVSMRFTKLVCYGSFSYLEQDRAELMLKLLARNFPYLERVFIGNCPDKNVIGEFYGNRNMSPEMENEPDSPIGIWRTQNEFVSLAQRCGWEASIHKMPIQYYAAQYRYDVILSR